MSENEFIPLSAQLGITGSSYLLQMGLVNSHWSIRLVKGQSVLDSKIFTDSDDIPNANKLTGWVLSVLVLPNINPYQIQKTIGFIRQKALRNYKDREESKKTAGKEERNDVKLEKVPEKQLKRVVHNSVIKDAEPSDSGVKVDAADVSPSLAASNKAAMVKEEVKSKAPAAKGPAVKATPGRRKLPTIPTGSPSEVKAIEAPTPSISKAATPTASEPSEREIMTALMKSSEYTELLKRVSSLEQTVKKLQQDNSDLHKEVMLLKKD